MCLGLPKNTSSGSTEAFVFVENIFICILKHIIKQFKLFYMSKDKSFKSRSIDIMCHENSVFLCSQQEFSLSY